VVRRLSGNMTVLNRLGRDGAAGLADASGSLDRLQALAEALDARVAGFRLPVNDPAPWASGIEAATDAPAAAGSATARTATTSGA